MDLVSEWVTGVERCKQKPCCCRLCQSTTCHFNHFTPLIL